MDDRDHPCYHCQNYTEDYDNSTGITDCDCKGKYGFHEEFGKTPCPCFKPILPSEDLYWQLAKEQEDAQSDDDLDRDEY